MIKTKSLLILIFSLLFSNYYLSSFTQELTITTYYPSPVGIYKELRAKKMAIGDNYYNPSDYSWGSEISSDADLVVEGRVGIGILRPLGQLHVHTEEFDHPAEIRFTTVDTGTGSTDGLLIGLTNTEMAEIWLYENKALRIATNDTERVRITADGNVGIGTVNPNGKLHVKTSSDIEVVRFEDEDGNKVVIDKDGNVSIEGELRVGDSGTLPTGRVGIYSRKHQMGIWDYGVWAEADGGVTGIGWKYGVKGVVRPNWSPDGKAIWGVVDDGYLYTSSSWAGYFQGGKGVKIEGDLYVTEVVYASDYEYGDIAENFLVREEVEEGDVVVVDLSSKEGLTKSKKPYSSLVIGVISKNPALIIGGKKGENYKPVALKGVVLTKVIGPIKRGDILVTSHKEGYAMKADLKKIFSPTQIVGIALDELKEKEGKIRVFVR